MRSIFGLLALICFAAFPAKGNANYEIAGTFPLQLSLWYPVQVLPGRFEVTGMKLNLPYGYNEHIVGLDIGVYGAGRVMEAVQVNVYNDVIEQMSGLQIGLINRTGSVAGLQTGLLNFNDLDVAGLQVGLINRAADINGVQIGLINTCEMMSGLQIGLVNVINDSGLPVMIGINASF